MRKNKNYLAMYQVLLIGAFPVGPAPSALPAAVSNTCESMGRQHAERYDSSQLIQTCSDEYKNSALPVNVRLSSNGNYLVYGAGDMFFSQTSNTGTSQAVTRVIAGKQSPLSDIRHIFLDEVSQELFVLDGAVENTLYVFQTSQNGNILPVRQFSSTDINNAIATATNPLASELYVLNRLTNSLNVYNRLADSRSHLPDHSVAMKRTINLSNYGIPAGAATDLAFDSNRAELYILNSNSGQVVVIDTRVVPTSSANPLRTLDATASGTITPAAIFFNTAKQALQVTGADRSLTYISSNPPTVPSSISSQ